MFVQDSRFNTMYSNISAHALLVMFLHAKDAIAFTDSVCTSPILVPWIWHYQIFWTFKFSLVHLHL